MGAMEDLVEKGLVKSIGLSNFNRRQIEEVLSKAKKHFPSVLQNESHPYLQEKDLRDFCRINKIIFQAYSALGSWDRPWKVEGSITSGTPTAGYEVLNHPTILKIAEKKGGKTAAQIILRWHLEMGGAMVTKSVTPSRIQSNFEIWDFNLTAEDMREISDLNIGWRHLLWAETSMHEDYPFKDWLPHGYVLQKPGKGSTATFKD